MPERLDQPLELPQLLPLPPGGRVERMRREVADRAVAPVVPEALLDEVVLVDDVMDRQELHGGDAERAEVRDRLLGGEPRVGAAQVVAHAGMELREAPDVRLVDHRLVPRRPRKLVALPIERRVDHDALRDRGRVVLVVGLEVGVGAAGDVRKHVRRIPVDRALDRLGIRVDQQLVGVEAPPLLRGPRPVHPVRVPPAGADLRQVAVPVERRPLGQRDARLVVVLVEEAELDVHGVLREQREVRPLAVPGRPEGEGAPRPDLHSNSSAIFAAKSATSVASPRRIVSVCPSASTRTSRGSLRRRASSLRY
jgi:hypothetical protein